MLTTRKRKRNSPVYAKKRPNINQEGPDLPPVVDTTTTGTPAPHTPVHPVPQTGPQPTTTQTHPAPSTDRPVVLIPFAKQDTQDTPTPTPMEITKRHLQTVPLTDRDRVRLDAESNPNRPALEGIYKEFYSDTGARKNSDAALQSQLKDKLYSMMGYGNADYIKDNVSGTEFDEFLKLPNADVNSQDLMFRKIAEHQAWNKTMVEWRKHRTPPRPTEPALTQTAEERQAALKKGDYFYVQNRNAGAPVKKQPQRRIVVNVGSQQAALKVAKALSGLFGDTAVAPQLKEFKVYLNNSDNKPTTVKRDKLVVYYSPDPDAPSDDDTIGNRIAETIEDAVDPSDVGGEFAPFYARIGPRTAWAEETEAFVQALKGSFTQTRERIIKDVVTANPGFPKGLDGFIGAIAKAFQDNWIDPDAPHTHLEPTTT